MLPKREEIAVLVTSTAEESVVESMRGLVFVPARGIIPPGGKVTRVPVLILTERLSVKAGPLPLEGSQE